MEDIEYYDIPVYNFPYDVEEDDEDTIQDNSELRVCFTSIVNDLVTQCVTYLGYDALLHHRFGGGS